MAKYEGIDVNTLNAHIAGLIHRRNQLDKQIKKLRSQRTRLLHGQVVGASHSGTQDKLAVPTVELRPYVLQALKEDTIAGLARRASVSARTINKIVGLHSTFTTLRIADSLLQAIGKPEALSNTVRVIGNPMFRDSDDNCS